MKEDNGLHISLPYKLYEAYRSDEITPSMYEAMVWLHWHADWSTGLVKLVSPERINYETSGHFKTDTLSKALHNLELCGWITRHTVPGRRGSYPVTIQNFEAMMGPRKGSILNLKETITYQEYKTNQSEHHSEDDAEDDAEESTAYTSIQHSASKEEKEEADFFFQAPALEPKPPRQTDAEVPAQALVAAEPNVQKYGETDSQTEAVEIPDTNPNPDSGGKMSNAALLPAHLYTPSEGAKKFTAQFAAKLGRVAGDYWAIRVDELITAYGKDVVVKCANNVFNNNGWWLEFIKSADNPLDAFASGIAKNKLQDLPPQKTQQVKKPQGRTVSSNYDTGKTAEDHAHLFAREV